MKALIVCYSRTGKNRTVAKMLQRQFKFDFEEIIDTKNRMGILGYWIAGRDSMRRRGTTLEPLKKDPSKYDLVIIATPYWAWTIPPAIRTYLEMNKDRIKKIAILSVSGAGEKNMDPTVEEVRALTGLDAVATLAFAEKEVNAGGFDSKVEEFGKGL